MVKVGVAVYPIPENEYLIDATCPRVLSIAIGFAIDPIPIFVSKPTGLTVIFGATA